MVTEDDKQSLPRLPLTCVRSCTRVSIRFESIKSLSITSHPARLALPNRILRISTLEICEGRGQLEGCTVSYEGAKMPAGRAL